MTYVRNAMAVVGLLALGYWFGAGKTVMAAGDGAQFELSSGLSEKSALLVYQPSNKTVYVYQGATQGNARVGCSFMFVLDRPGDAIQRVSCSPSSAF